MLLLFSTNIKSGGNRTHTLSTFLCHLNSFSQLIFWLHLQCYKTIDFQTTYLCTLLSEKLGRPKLALVTIWGAPRWLWCHNGAGDNSGIRVESPVPARGAQFQHGARQNRNFRPVLARCHNGAVFVPVPARGKKDVPVPARGRCQFGTQHIQELRDL